MAWRGPRKIIGSIRTAGAAVVLVLSVVTAGCSTTGSAGGSAAGDGANGSTTIGLQDRTATTARSGAADTTTASGPRPTTTAAAGASDAGLDCAPLEPITRDLVVHPSSEDTNDLSIDDDPSTWGSVFDDMIDALPADRSEPLIELKQITTDLAAVYRDPGTTPTGTDPGDSYDGPGLEEIYARFDAVETRYLDLARWVTDQCAGYRIRWACESQDQRSTATFERVGDAIDADGNTVPPAPDRSPTPEEAVGGVAGTTEAFRTDGEVGWVTLDAEGRATELQTAERSGDGWVEGSTYTCTTSDGSPDEEFTPIGEAVGD
jgi:hypothetical protein